MDIQVMKVIKRNGNLETVQFDKITARLYNLLKINDYILDKIDPIIIAKNIINRIYDNITTQELDIESAKFCASYYTNEPQYGILASRICISNLQKMAPDTFYLAMKELMNNYDLNNTKTPILNKEVFNIIETNKDIINSKIKKDNDYLIDYFGFKTLEKAYLMKSNGIIVETPQYMFMRISIAIHRNNLSKAFETYDLISQKIFTHASPTLFNSGTNNEQLSSCFLMGSNDSIDGIFKSVSDCAKISKAAGGIGIHIHNIRSNGSLIRTTNGKSNGIVPMLQVFNFTARYTDQGGRRPGSFAIYIEPWHADIFEFLDLKKNTGSELDRARDLFLALWIPNLFIEKVLNDDYWYLMCPDQSKGLSDVYDIKFNELYYEYINENKFRKKIKARDLWNKIIETQIETGNPYILYKDHVNNKNNQSNIGTIKSSNLCCEILEYSDDKETAVCNLASIALNMFVENKIIDGIFKIITKDNCVYCSLAKMLLKNNNYNYVEIDKDDHIMNKEDNTISNCVNGTCGIKKYPQIYLNDNFIGGYVDLKAYLEPIYNFEKLKNVSKIVCRNLNNIIDINYYPIPEAKYSNLRHRPIGIGVQGWADTLFKMRYNFDSEEAIELNKKIFETIYYGALEESMLIAKELDDKINKIINDNNIILFNEKIIEFFEDIKYSVDGTYHHFLKDISRLKNKGAYHSYDGSPISKGKFQFDFWNVKPSLWDWNELKNNIKQYGVRNSLVTALMPTASTSQILGNNECFEAITSNIYKRKTLAGEFQLVNKYLIQDLQNLDMWNNDIKEQIISNNGSIQNIDLPNDIKKLYKTVWEIKQKDVIILCHTRAPYIDQTQSMNIFMENCDFDKISSSHIYAWKLGLKTGIYYFRTKPAANAIKYSVENKQNVAVSVSSKNYEYEECLNCSA